jgi:maleylacetoacetate isomerase
VLQQVATHFDTDKEAKKTEWAAFWIHRGFDALEKVLEKTSGQFSVGDELTMADLYIPPQVFD